MATAADLWWSPEERDALILWSGGCDSTVVLKRLLCDNSGRQRRVRTLSIRHPQFLAAEEQKRARNRIYDYLVNSRGFSRFERADVELSHSENAELFGYSCQPLTWLAIGQGYLRDDEDLYLGYMETDSVWHVMQHVRAAFDAMQAASGKKGKLVLPIEYATRDAVTIDLGDLHKLCWWCESPTPVGAGFIELGDDLTNPCGACNPCRSHASSNAAALKDAVAELAGKLRVEYADDKTSHAITRLAMAERLEKLLGC